jgi:predicted protein tyrosine phosphatase
MKFLVLSRKMVESGKAIPNMEHVIISITNPDDPLAVIPFSLSCKGILRLQFHDIERKLTPYKTFNKTMAKKIVKFVTDYEPKIKLFVVHCEAGISRSAATAAAISKFFYNSDQEFFTRYRPNMLVYRILLECLLEKKK